VTTDRRYVLDSNVFITAKNLYYAFLQRSSQYFDNAKAEFTTGADGWLVAYAKVHNAIVVTNEQSRPDAKSRVPLPNVCEQFEVSYTNTFSMLRDLFVHFDLRGVA